MSTMFELERNEQDETHADEAYEAIRALNHETIAVAAIPAPAVYSILGNLKHAGGYGLAQTLEQLSRGLTNSLDAYEVYEDDGYDPGLRVKAAAMCFTEAANHARAIGRLLESAQSAIARQGYKDSGGEGGGA